MADLQPPIIPAYLYRYRSLSRSTRALQEEINSITENYLHCSEFTLMNDPMEGFTGQAYCLKGRRIIGELLARSLTVNQASA